MVNNVRLLFFVLLGLLPSAAHAILPIQTWQTSTGARVLFVENRSIPVLDLSVDFRAGAAFDANERTGVASMTNRLLRLGTGKLGEDQIAGALADVGAVMSGRFDTDRAGLYLRTLSYAAERGQALDIFAEVLRSPAFPQAVLDREKVRLVGALKESNLKPDTIAAVTFNRLVFRSHPYGRRSSGEVETVEKIVRDDLVSFYQKHYVAQHAIVSVMGDVSRQEAEAIAEQVTRGLRRTDDASVKIPPVQKLDVGVMRWMAHPAAQSHILIGAPGMRRDDPDYFPLLVGNHVLGGGGFVSRINEEVRQKRGLAYSAYSYFAPLQQDGAFIIGMQTRRDQAKEALGVVRDTLARFMKDGPSASELEAAKQNLVGGFPMRIDTNRKIHEYLAIIGFYGLPLIYLDDFVGKIEAVTLESIRDAFRRRIDPGKLVTVVVGATEDSPAGKAQP
jgi:zinc protease